MYIYIYIYICGNTIQALSALTNITSLLGLLDKSGLKILAYQSTKNGHTLRLPKGNFN